MNLALLTLGGLALAGTYLGFKKKDPTMNLSSCFFDKLATPLYTFFNEYHSNSLFLIDSIKEDHIICNTPYQALYAIEIRTNETLQKFVNESKIKEIIRDNKDQNDSFFYYVLHKQKEFQKQYIFSHSKRLIKSFADYFGIELLSGLEIANALYNQYLQNNFFIENKQIKQSLEIKKQDNFDEPEFMAFKRLVRQAIRKNYKDIDIFQVFKHLNIKESDINSLFRLNFEGSIWFFIDISSKRILNHITKLINYSKFVGDKKPFVDLEKSYQNKKCDLAIINGIAFLKKYDEEIIGNMGNCLKSSFICKELFKSKHLQKNPIKFKDSEFDFLVKEDFLYNFIASIHKKI